MGAPPADGRPVNIGPNWFASVMGTGIISVAAKSLPIHAPLVEAIAVIFWMAASSLLVLITAAYAIHCATTPERLSTQVNDASMIQFFGAPPMALLTVGTATLLAGAPVIGLELAVQIDWGLWFLGTALGLATAIIIPYLLFTKFEVRADGAFGGWLMPLVPPMVSAAAGANLVPYASSGDAQATLLYACYAMFGLSLIAALIVISMIWSRLAHHGSSGGVRVPTLWIVLGPLGQSMTAVGALGSKASLALPPEVASAFNVMAITFGVPVWGFAFLWACFAFLLTVRARMRGMPFALTWWAFTFPIGTCVTGTSQLARHTNLPAFSVAAAILFAGLLAAWVVAALPTLRWSIRGHLLRPTSGTPAISSKDDSAGPLQRSL
jgi:C4-dicarboxylate transporter/malic acid transport protein